MAYYIKKFDKGVIKITDEDMKAIFGKTGMLMIRSLNRGIHSSQITEIVPEKQYHLEMKEKRSESNRGVLHDGTEVIRRFGGYYLLSDPEVVIDSKHYPEVAKDSVPTPQEYEQNYAKLPQEKRLEAILGTIDDKERLGGGFKKIGDIKKQ